MKNKESENTEVVENKDNEIVETNKDKFHGFIKSKYPDEEIDEDGIYGRAMSHVSSLEEYQTKNKASNKQIAEVLMAEPSLAKVIKGIADGMTLREALSRYVDIEGLTAMEGDPDYEALNSAKETRMKEMEAANSAAEEFEKNREMSYKQIEEFATENNMSEEEVGGLFNYIDKQMEGFANGIVSKDFLNAWRKSASYEKDIAEAAEIAAIDAKNEVIEIKNNLKPNKTDGMPAISSTEPETEKKSSSNVFSNAMKPKRRTMIS